MGWSYTASLICCNLLGGVDLRRHGLLNMRHLCSNGRCDSSNTCNGAEGNKEFIKSEVQTTVGLMCNSSVQIFGDCMSSRNFILHCHPLEYVYVNLSFKCIQNISTP